MPSNKAFQPLSKSDVAEILGISIKCLDNWVNSGILLPPAKLGNKVYWHPDAFYEWLDAVFRQQHAEPHVAIVTLPQAGEGGEPSTQKPVKVGRALKTTRPNNELAKLRARDESLLVELLDS